MSKAAQKKEKQEWAMQEPKLDIANGLCRNQSSTSRMGYAGTKTRHREWAMQKPKLDIARKWRGIYFIDPEDREYKETIDNAKEESGGSNKKGQCPVRWR